MKKIIGGLVMSIVLTFSVSANNPSSTEDGLTKGDAQTESSETTKNPRKIDNTTKGIIPAVSDNGDEKQNQFAQRIQDGTVSLNDIPLMIIYWIEWLLTLAGGIAVGFIMYGGFQYMIGGLTNEKEQGKNTLLYAISGLGVTFMAYVIVDLIQSWYTSGF